MTGAEGPSFPAFDGDHAYSLLKQQCAFGPRIPATAPHDQCRSLILANLSPFVDKTVTQNWTWTDNARHVTLPLTNILGIINPSAPTKILLLTHWDTRPTADQELDKINQRKPIPGADDGASGTATLLELARALHKHKPSVCVELLFVDGEDWGPGDDKMYLGAIHFAKDPGPYRPQFAILLDMIGDKNLTIPREASSQMLAPNINDLVWNAAHALGYQKEFPDFVGQQILDDHDSFNAVGIPCIDLIDFNYAYWHTLADTPDKCSARSLKVVGEVMEKVIYDAR